MLFDKDLLSKIILPLRLESAFVSLWSVAGEWSFDGPKEPLALFHYLAQGTLFVGTQCGKTMIINEGDLIIFPHGMAHRIGGSSDSRTSIPLDAVLPKRELGSFARIDLPGSDNHTKVLCAGLLYSSTAAGSIYDLFPEILIVRRYEMASHPLLSGLLQGLVEEAETFQEGKEFILHKGLELAYVLGVRTAMSIDTKTSIGSQKALDPRIQRSLVHMHTNFNRRLNTVDVASTIGMSRSAFSLAFKQATGHTPAKYLSKIRVFEAKRLMKTTTLNKDEIAFRVGFESAVGLYLAIKSNTESVYSPAPEHD